MKRATLKSGSGGKGRSSGGTAWFNRHPAYAVVADSQGPWQALWAVMQCAKPGALVKVMAGRLVGAVVDAVVCANGRDDRSRAVDAAIRERLERIPSVAKVMEDVREHSGNPDGTVTRAWAQAALEPRVWAREGPPGVSWGPVGSPGWNCLLGVAQWMASSAATAVCANAVATLGDVSVLLANEGLVGLLLAACACLPAETDTAVVMQVVMFAPPSEDPCLQATMPRVHEVLEQACLVPSAAVRSAIVGRLCCRLTGVTAGSLPLARLALRNVCRDTGAADVSDVDFDRVLRNVVVPCLRDAWRAPAAVWARDVEACVLQPLEASASVQEAGLRMSGYARSLVVGCLVPLALETDTRDALLAAMRVATACAQGFDATVDWPHLPTVLDHVARLAHALQRFTWPFSLAEVVGATLPSCRRVQHLTTTRQHEWCSQWLQPMLRVLRTLHVPPHVSAAAASTSLGVAAAVVEAFECEGPVLRGLLFDCEKEAIVRALAPVAARPYQVLSTLGMHRSADLCAWVGRAWTPVRLAWVVAVVRAVGGPGPAGRGPARKARRVVIEC
jgi:hypothetical protein